MNWSDPSGLDGLDNAANFIAGWGDTLTLGGTKIARKYVGEVLGVGDANEAVNTDSGWYRGGEATGFVHSAAFGVAGGLKAAGAKQACKEFSHWVPNRIVKKILARAPRCVKGLGRSKLNGNFVTPARHFLHDAYRYPKGCRELGSKWHPILQQIDRVPRLIYGSAAGAGWGGAENVANR